MRNQKKTKAAGVPVIQLTRQELAEIKCVTTEEEIVALQGQGVLRVKAEGDAGNWFVCYPDTKEVFRVQIVDQVFRVNLDRQRLKSARPGLVG